MVKKLDISNYLRLLGNRDNTLPLNIKVALAKYITKNLSHEEIIDWFHQNDHILDILICTILSKEREFTDVFLDKIRDRIIYEYLVCNILRSKADADDIKYIFSKLTDIWPQRLPNKCHGYYYHYYRRNTANMITIVDTFIDMGCDFNDDINDYHPDHTGNYSSIMAYIWFYRNYDSFSEANYIELITHVTKRGQYLKLLPLHFQPIVDNMVTMINLVLYLRKTLPIDIIRCIKYALIKH